MTLIEDSYEEMISEYGRKFEHYSHKGYGSEEDEFWNDDQGFPDEPTDTFEGQIVMEPESSEFTIGGFRGTESITIRTQYSKVERGDAIGIDGNIYKVDKIGRREIQGRTFAHQLEVSSSNV